MKSVTACVVVYMYIYICMRVPVSFKAISVYLYNITFQFGSQFVALGWLDPTGDDTVQCFHDQDRQNVKKVQFFLKQDCYLR